VEFTSLETLVNPGFLYKGVQLILSNLFLGDFQNQPLENESGWNVDMWLCSEVYTKVSFALDLRRGVRTLQFFCLEGDIWVHSKERKLHEHDIWALGCIWTLTSSWKWIKLDILNKGVTNFSLAKYYGWSRPWEFKNAIEELVVYWTWSQKSKERSWK
jgi:hypothetical protein